jgi:hypothetical protein
MEQAAKPQDELVQLGWRIPRRLKYALRRLADERQTSVEEQARRALERYLAQEQEREKSG